jgi:hypothetical protein
MPNDNLTKAQRRIWEDVQRTRERTECECDLKPGLDWDALRALGGGCKSKREPGRKAGQGMALFVCPALDLYRREVGYPPLDPETGEDRKPEAEAAAA